MGRRVRYQVAVSLDGFIAGTKGEYDWIVNDPTIDFAALYREFDTALMGRHTYDLMRSMGEAGAMPGIDIVAFSRTLPAVEKKGLRVTSQDPADVVTALKKQRGKDIWLFGGGQLFRTLLDAGLVDTVEVAVMPVLIGDGIPLLPAGARARLALTDHRVLPKSGIVMLAYRVAGSRAAPPRIRSVRPARARAGTKKARRAKKR